jgi:hypothetical protein
VTGTRHRGQAADITFTTELAGYANLVAGMISGQTGAMKILSVNVGLPREVIWQGKLVATGIFKEPVNVPVMVRTLNLDGDQQADLTVHGGVNKAVYVYPLGALRLLAS